MNLKTLHKTMLTALLLVTTVISGMGQAFSFTSGNLTYTNNFDAIGATGTTYPTGWNSIRFSGTGTLNADLVMAVTDGAAASGGIYNVGTASAADRALGVLGSGSTVPAYGASFINNTGSVLSSFNFSLMLEQWKNASIATVNEKNIFQYSLDATSLSTGTWIAFSALDLNEINIAATDNLKIDGNAAANRVSVTGSISGLLLADGAKIWFRWIDDNATGNDCLLAIDDLSVTAVIYSDTQAPAATIAPADGATDIALNSPITITFDEAIRNIGNTPIADPTSLITLKETDASGDAVAFTSAIDGANKVITINPTNQKFGQTYYVAIAPVEDASGNATTEKTSTYTTIAAKTGKAITAFSFAEKTGDATFGDGTIAIEVASSATVTNLIATFTVSDGANVKVGAVDQVSGTTANDFTAPVTYTVTAEDGSTKDWVVTVTKAVAKSTETDITTFSFVEQTGTATIDAVNHTIAIEVGATTDITALVPTITLSVGATVNPLSGAAQNFTSPVVYTVTAEDGTTTQTWTVTVTLASTIANTTTLAEKYYAGDNLTVTWTSANLTNVKVEWFDGTTWSDLAASVPATDGQYVITIPAASKYGTAYKFRISDAAKATVKAESNAITIIAVVNNITEFKALTPNDIAKIKGEVFISFIRSANRNQKYIQDAEGGLLVDDPTPTGGQSGVITSAYAEKDGITGIEGKLVMFGTYTYEIVPTVDPGAKTSSNNALTPKVITLAELKADHMKYQSMLVKVQGVTIKEANGTVKFVASSGSSNYTMQLGAEEAVVRQAWKTGETDLIDATIPVGTLDIVGIVGQFTTGTPAVTTAQLQPRRVSDISVINGVETNNEVVTKAFPNPFSTDFKINAGKVVRNVVVSNMLGQKVMERTYNETEIEVPASDLRTGVYFVTVKFEDGTSSTLRMVKK